MELYAGIDLHSNNSVAGTARECPHRSLLIRSTDHAGRHRFGSGHQGGRQPRLRDVGLRRLARRSDCDGDHGPMTEATSPFMPPQITRIDGAAFSVLVDEVRRCTVCTAQLPSGPRPVLQVHPAARILIAGQAPGRKVHESGVPFDDASGERLRAWMGVTRDVFYDSTQIAILPMGF